MSYSGRRWDVFISYAHLDNEPLEGASGWVTSFAIRFKKALTSYLGATFELLFDEKLSSGNATLEQLEDAARNSAVLIGIGSPAYAQREWLKKELDAFRSRCETDERLFLVEYLPLDTDLHYPSPMDRKIAKRFWRTKSEFADTPVPFMPMEEGFNTFVLDVAKKVQDQLGLLHAKPTQDTASGTAAVTAHPASRAAAPVKYLLIAQPTDDLSDDVENVRRHLGQYPEIVGLLPQADYPQGGAEFRKAFDADLSKADIFVQLLGTSPGRRTEGLAQGYTAYQLEAAGQLKKPIIQWRHPQLDLAAVRDETYRAILSDPKVTVCGFEEFKAMLLAVARTDKPAQGATTDNVFVNADRYNRASAESLQREFTKAKYRVALPKFESSAAEKRAHLNAMLTACSIIVFVNGSDDRAWFETQKRLFDVLRTERPIAPLAVAVCTVPPAKPPDRDFLGNDFDEIDCSDEYDPVRIQAFIATLRGRAGAPPNGEDSRQ